MLGSKILTALLEPPRPLVYQPAVIVFLRPGRSLDESLLRDYPELQIVNIDYSKKGADLVERLRGVDAVISALNGLTLTYKQGSDASIPRSMASTIYIVRQAIRGRV